MNPAWHVVQQAGQDHLSIAPFFWREPRALWSIVVGGGKRYLKKSRMVGFSGMRGRRGSAAIRRSLPFVGGAV